MKWIKDIHQPERITVTTMVHIPFLDGYWKENLEVLKLCLSSMRESTQLPFDLMVFDNKSCTEVKDYLLSLHYKGQIQYLILSGHNLGKVGAWNFLFSSAPGEIISYTDSDVYFLKGWLEESLKILEAFPEAGMVTAQPIAGGDISKLWTAQAALKDPSITVQTGILIPEKYLIAHLKGLMAPPEEYGRRQKDRKDALLTRGNVSAYATASHFQFTTTCKVIHLLFPAKTTIPLGDDMQFDEEMRKIGFWRLSTVDYLVHHMGNKIPDLQSELPWAKITDQFQIRSLNDTHYSNPFIGRISQNIFIRKLLKKINVMSYTLLYYFPSKSKR